MKCPKCPGKLRELNFNGVELNSCYVCEGLWFDAGELEDVIVKDSKNFDFLGLDDKDYDGKEVSALSKQVDKIEGICPRCDDDTLMKQQKCDYNKDVTIDICTKGHGVWLDGGEIKHLRKRFIANLKDKIDFCIQFVKYTYSLNGIKQMAKSLRKKSNDD